MPLFRKKKPNHDGAWVPADQEISKYEGTPAGPIGTTGDTTGLSSPMPAPVQGRGKKKKKVFRVVTVWGRQQQDWLDSNLWQPLQETITQDEAKAPLTVVYYGTYGSDGMRHDGSPGGAYSSVFDQYAMQGSDLYTRDEARRLKQWDTRKPFPGFDPTLGSTTLDIFSED